MSKEFNRGMFNRRITIRDVVKTEDDLGGHSEVYSDVLTTWAKVEHKSGRRALVEGNDIPIEVVVFSVNHRAAMDALTKDIRIVYLGREYALTQPPYFHREIKQIKIFETVGS